MIRRRWLYAFMLVIGTPAHAASWPASIFAGADPKSLADVKAFPDLVNQAENFLHPCSASEVSKNCQSNQQAFVLAYIYAVFNDKTSQQNIAFLLSGDGESPAYTGPGAQEVGISPDPVWGCAWRIAVIGSGDSQFGNNDLGDYQNDCLRLSPTQQSEADDIYNGVILQEMNTDLGNSLRPVSGS